MSEEEVVIAEDSQLMSIAKGWTGTFKEAKTIYNRKNNSQIELLVDKKDLISLATYLKEQGWTYITSLSGVDYPERTGGYKRRWLYSIEPNLL